jgi:WXG100 family type VII secretion target
MPTAAPPAGGSSSVLDEVYGIQGDVDDAVSAANDEASQDPGDDGGGDPLEKLIDQGLSFVIDYITPLKDALNLVTGDPDALTAAAQHYQSLGQQIDQLGQSIHDEVKQGVAGWTGDASTAAQQQIADFLDGVHGTATLAGYIAQVCSASAGFMTSAKNQIIDLIAQFVEQMLITWAVGLAGSIFTFGASDAAAAASTAAEAAAKIAQCAQKCEKFGQVLAKIGKVIEKITEIVKKIGGLVEKLGTAVEKFAGKGLADGERLGAFAAKLKDLKEGGGLLGKAATKVGDKIGTVGANLKTLGQDAVSGAGHLDDLVHGVASGDETAARTGAANLTGDLHNLKDGAGDLTGEHDPEDRWKSDYTATADHGQPPGLHRSTNSVGTAAGAGWDAVKEKAGETFEDDWADAKDHIQDSVDDAAQRIDDAAPPRSAADIDAELSEPRWPSAAEGATG